ncbi:MAG: methyltransferase domain-containing protein [Nostocoides sp.]
MTSWDPTQYARFADHRNRPFFELLGRVGASAPRLVVDLGCGNGPLTVALAERWPDARIVGVDNSASMLAAARDLDSEGRVEWVEADIATWDLPSLGAAPDVIVSNAALQWVPGHLPLLDAWVAGLAVDGWFALQVPGNFRAPSHRLMRDVAELHARSGELEAALKRAGSAEPATYLQFLARAGCEVDAWETTYEQILDPAGEQENPVLEWVSGTGLRPVLDLLTEPAERAAFLEPYAASLLAAYPRTPVGVILPFRRVFAVGHRTATSVEVRQVS